MTMPRASRTLLSCALTWATLAFPTPHAPAGADKTTHAEAPDAPAPDRPALLARLTEQPWDDEAIVELSRSCPRQTPRQELTCLIEVIGALPPGAWRERDILVTAHHPGADLLAAWDELDEPLRATPEARVTRTWLRAMIGRVDEELVAEAASIPGLRAIGAHLEVLRLLGMADDADQVLDTLSASDDPNARLAASSGLVDRGRYADALRVLDDLKGDVPEPERLVLAARCVRGIEGGHGAAADVLWTAAGLAPKRDTIFAWLLRFHGLGAPHNPALSNVLHAQRRSNASSPNLAWARGARAASSGQLDIAAAQMQAIWDRYPMRWEFFETLVDVWEQGRRADLAEQALLDWTNRWPADGRAAALLARILTAQDRSDEAAALLRDFNSNFPGDDPASIALQDIYTERGQMARGKRVAIARLDRSPRTFDNLIERARVHVMVSDETAAITALDEALDTVVGRISPQRMQPLEGVYTSLVLLGTHGAVDADTVIAAVDRFRERAGALPPGLLQQWFILRAHHAEDDEAYERIAQDVARLASETTGGADDLFLNMGEALWDKAKAERRFDFEPVEFNRGPGRAAIDLYTKGLHDAGRPEAVAITRRVIEVFLETESRSAGLSPIAEALLAQSIDLATQRGIFNDAIARHLGDSIVRANSLYQFAILRPDDAFTTQRALYEAILAARPDHANAANNLGYGLLERGEDFDYAVELIELAYEEGGWNDENVVDSLGWARYKQGIFDDAPGAVPPGQRNHDGLGAISLLEHALALAEGGIATEIIVGDHLGDALWRAGATDRAMAAWDRAAAAADTVPQFNLATEARDVVINARGKRAAAEAGREPIVAPIASETSHTPG